MTSTGLDHCSRVFTSDGAELCRQLSSDLSSGGEYWNLQQHPADGALGLVCVMTRNGQTLRVEDSGSAIYGRNVCASLLSYKWQEDTAAEQTVSASAQARDQAEAEASAQQEASASASAQRQRDQHAAAEAVAQLLSDTQELNGNVKQLRSDVAQADSDLTQTRRDAASGAGDYCSNMGTVSADASGTVAADVTRTVASTVDSSVQPALDRVRSDLSSLSQAAATLRTEGLPEPLVKVPRSPMHVWRSRPP